MKKQFFDAKRLLFWFVATLTLTVLGVSALGIQVVKESKIDSLRRELEQILKVGSTQVTDGNFRGLFESFITSNSVYDLSVIKKNTVLFHYGNRESSFSSICFQYPISELNFTISSCAKTNAVANFLSILFAIYFILIISGYFYLRVLEKNSSRQLYRLLKSVGVPVENEQMTLSDVLSNVASVVEGYHANKASENELIKLNVMKKISDQVSHDIRSPLAALELLLPTLDKIGEEKRGILRSSTHRIRDIINSLKHQVPKALDNVEPQEENSSQSVIETLLISPMVESIVSEKGVQFIEQNNIQIIFNQTHENYGLFADVDATHFKRIISNLLNNAIEALPNQTGVVNVDITSKDSSVIISISDNGKGISPEVLLKLGTRGETHGKAGGSGLGLHHAKTLTEEWGGGLELTSVLGAGTTASLTLLKKQEPKWFVSKIHLDKKTILVIFDDDDSIHQIWSERLNNKGSLGKEISVVNCKTFKEIRKFYGLNFIDLDRALFLIDYEIIGEKETGIDLIQELGIQQQTILVTSRYDEKQIFEFCEHSGVRLIPKSMCGFVPIDIV